MKKILTTLTVALIATMVFGKTINFRITNKTGVELQVFYQIIQTTEKDNPEFIFNLTANSQRPIPLKVKKGQKIKKIYNKAGKRRENIKESQLYRCARA